MAKGETTDDQNSHHDGLNLLAVRFRDNMLLGSVESYAGSEHIEEWHQTPETE